MFQLADVTVTPSSKEPILIVSETVLSVLIFTVFPAFPVPIFMVFALFPVPSLTFQVVPESKVKEFDTDAD